MAYFLAIDVGGTKIAIGVGDESGAFRGIRTLATHPSWAKEAAIANIYEAALELLSEVHVDLTECRRVGLGTPGPLDGTRLLESSNLVAWKGLDWRAELEAKFHIPVAVANDATAAGLAEWQFGAARGTRDAIYVTVSTGIGAGIIAGGALYGGARGNAGEFGHIIMQPEGPLCHAGHRGCLESLASGTAIRRMGQERQEQSEYLKVLATVDTKDVFDGYIRGDEVCVDIVHGAADRLGLGLSYLVDLFNPEKIVLGGGVATHAPASYRQRVAAAMARWALPSLASIVTVVPAELGEDSGIKGALALAITQTP
ncbi:MAG: ROK family protein [Firmicutes bacterium]|nr:ROK family protein [Bacillota bacterium]